MEMELEREGWGCDDELYLNAWDDDDYEVNVEREWERMAWLNDELVPLDTYLKLR